MTRALRSRRLVLVGAIAILGLTACGSAGTTSNTGSPATSSAASSDTSATTTAGHAPAVIVIGAQLGAGGAAGSTSPMAETANDGSADPAFAPGDMKMRPTNIVYEYAGTPPDLPVTAPAWYFPLDQHATPEQIAAVAAAFGVQGDVVAVSEDQGGGWLVGPSDYSGPTVQVSPDAMQSWWYGGGATAPSVGPCEAIVSVEGTPVTADVQPEQAGGGGETNGADAATDEAPDAAAPVGSAVEPAPPADTKPEPIVEPGDPLPCAEIAPPEGVPTKDEAEQLAKDLFAKLGMDPAAYEYETYADEWNASVTAYLVLDDVRTSVSAYIGFGANAHVAWAGGYLGTPVRGDDYPLIGVLGGVDRLNEQAAMWAEPGVMESGAATDIAAADAPTAVSETVSGEEPPPPPDSTMCDPACPKPTDPVPAEPETITVTFTDVHPSLEQVWAADGTVWLLPGYRFDAQDGGWYTVTAVEDQYLQQADQTDPATDPMTPDATSGTGTASGGGTAAPAADCPSFEMPAPGNTEPTPIIEEGVQWYVGLCVDDAKAAAEQVGYTFRVVREDGVDLPATDDFNGWRVNVAVEDNVVTEIVSIG